MPQLSNNGAFSTQKEVRGSCAVVSISGIFKADLNLDDLERLRNVQVSSIKKLIFLKKREMKKNVFNLLSRVRFLLCIIRSLRAGKEHGRCFSNLSKACGTGCTFQGSPLVLWSRALSCRSLQCIQNYRTISEKRCKSRGLGRNDRESPGQRRSRVLRQSPFILRRETSKAANVFALFQI